MSFVKRHKVLLGIIAALILLWLWLRPTPIPVGEVTATLGGVPVTLDAAI